MIEPGSAEENVQSSLQHQVAPPTTSASLISPFLNRILDMSQEEEALLLSSTLPDLQQRQQPRFPFRIPQAHPGALDPRLAPGISNKSERPDSIPPPFMVEEIIMYFMLFLLLLFLCFHLIRCVRATLDPYRSVARAAWFETLSKDSSTDQVLIRNAGKDANVDEKLTSAKSGSHLAPTR